MAKDAIEIKATEKDSPIGKIQGSMFVEHSSRDTGSGICRCP